MELEGCELQLKQASHWFWFQTPLHKGHYGKHCVQQSERSQYQNIEKTSDTQKLTAHQKLSVTLLKRNIVYFGDPKHFKTNKNIQ